MKLWSSVIAGCAIVALCAACGAESSSDSAAVTDAESSTTSEPAQTTTDATPAAGSGSANATPQTLDEYLGLSANLVRGGGGAGGGTFDEDQALEQQRLVQQEVQRCMQAQGFDYVPEETGDGLRFFLASQGAGQSPVDYASAEGFGISTGFDSVLEGDIDLTESVSPNDEHLATLSEGEADAWEFALRGAPPERNEQGQLIDPETGEVVQGQGRGRQAAAGCTGTAQDVVRGDAEALAELAQDFDELEERIAADPRMTEIARAWTDCMRVEGFDYQDEAEARAEINQEFRPLLRSFFQSAGNDNQGADQGQQQGQAGQGGGNPLQRISGLELTAEQEVELRALQDRERSIAVASATCQGDSAEEIAEINESYEAEFIESNRAALEALAG